MQTQTSIAIDRLVPDLFDADRDFLTVAAVLDRVPQWGLDLMVRRGLVRVCPPGTFPRYSEAVVTPPAYPELQQGVPCWTEELSAALDACRREATLRDTLLAAARSPAAGDLTWTYQTPQGGLGLSRHLPPAALVTGVTPGPGGPDGVDGVPPVRLDTLPVEPLSDARPDPQWRATEGDRRFVVYPLIGEEGFAPAAPAAPVFTITYAVGPSGSPHVLPGHEAVPCGPGEPFGCRERLSVSRCARCGERFYASTLRDGACRLCRTRQA